MARRVERYRVREWLEDPVTQALIGELERLNDANTSINMVNTLDDLNKLKGRIEILQILRNPYGKLSAVIETPPQGDD